MLKLMGVVLVLGACSALGISARQELRRRVAAADSMLLALSLISSEVSCRRTPIPEIINELSKNDDENIKYVFSSLAHRLREQNGLSLGYLWSANLRDAGARIGLGKPECGILCSAANYLGRYDADEQAAGLEHVSRLLSASREAAQQELMSKGNLYRTCGIAAGLLVILVLI